MAPAPPAAPYLQVEGLVKDFAVGAAAAVNGVSFGVDAGKITTLLGPSGCGKTTTLRCIAGLETPSEGTIVIGGDTVTSTTQRLLVPAERRNVGMVFQSYAVWPHMTVAQNLALPLEVRRTPRAEIRERIGAMLDLVGLSGFADRYANRLSGGQQQRVALARALIFNPRLLLLDEPLSNLDAQLRERMRHEIRRLQREVGVTSVYVTHDQAEAMVISDRIIIMNQGKIVQEGDAETLYSRPTNAFVATFIGVANLVEGSVVVVVQPSTTWADATSLLIETPGYSPLVLRMPRPSDAQSRGRAYVFIRPEDIVLHCTPPTDRPNVVDGRIQSVEYLGNLTHYQVSAAGRTWRVQAHPGQRFTTGEAVTIELPPHSCLCLPSAEPGTPSAVAADVAELAAAPAP
jgi:iron(III) transport system ATP-binding protein